MLAKNPSKRLAKIELIQTQQFFNGFNFSDVEYLITTYDALGSSAVLSSYKQGVKIITVKNKTVLNVTSEKLNIKPYREYETYEQCLKEITNKG